MKERYEGFSPLIRIPSIAASGIANCGLINCRALDKICLSIQATFNGSSTTDATLKIYYSPDGKNFDTIVYDSITLTVSAGNVTQRSELINVPDTGFLKIIVSNDCQSYALTNISIWASVVYKFFEDIQTNAST